MSMFPLEESDSYMIAYWFNEEKTQEFMGIGSVFWTDEANKLWGELTDAMYGISIDVECNTDEHGNDLFRIITYEDESNEVVKEILDRYDFPYTETPLADAEHKKEIFVTGIEGGEGEDFFETYPVSIERLMNAMPSYTGQFKPEIMLRINEIAAGGADRYTEYRLY